MCPMLHDPLQRAPLPKGKKSIFRFIGKVKDLKKAIAKELDAHYGLIPLE